MVLANKQVWALGISNLVGLNEALMLKWWWCFLNNPEALWVRFIKSIHGDSGNFVIGCRGSRVKRAWSFIVVVTQTLH